MRNVGRKLSRHSATDDRSDDHPSCPRQKIQPDKFFDAEQMFGASGILIADLPPS